MKNENRYNLSNQVKSAMAGTAVMLAPVAAFAQVADPTAAIKSQIETYGGYAVGVVIAFALAVWGLRAAGLIGRRG